MLLGEKNKAAGGYRRPQVERVGFSVRVATRVEDHLDQKAASLRLHTYCLP